jgi:Eukaryotic protein of unknown function (DUF829)
MSSVKTTLLQSGVEVVVMSSSGGFAVQGPPPRLATDLLVVLVGFMGATQRQMERIAGVYLDIFRNTSAIQHWSVMIVQPPVSFVLSAGMSSNATRNGYGALAEDLSSMHADQRDPPVLLHLCSNAGAFLFEALHSIRSPLLSRITGYIFDCGPVDITAKAIRTATQQVLGDYVADIVVRGFHALLPSDEFEKRRTEFAQIFSSGSSSTRKLFLYSTADKIADSRFIENVIRNTSSKAYNFEVAAHMQGLKLFAKLYKDQIHMFLDETIARLPQQRNSRL